MSLNTQLSKEARFIHSIFYMAANAARMEEELPPASMIIAGGAIRDLYFDRKYSRDLDMYFDSNMIDPHEFARNLKRVDVDQEARKAGFMSASIVRVSDLQENIMKFAVLPTGFGQLTPQQVQATSTSGSGSKMDPGGKAHPLQAVEEFVCFIDGYRYQVELMQLSMNPAQYVQTHFAVKLSRCYYDGKSIKYTNDFFEDARNKTLTVACPVEHARFERLFSYYLPKLKSYFPDFDVRVDLNQINSTRRY